MKRNTFGLSFIISFLLFLVLFVFYRTSYFYEAFLHFAFLSLALYLIADEKDDLRSIMKKIGIPPKSIMRTILFSFLGFALVVCVMIALALVLSFFGFADNQKVFNVLQKVPIWILPFAVIIAPITEEMLFRAALVPRIGIVGSSILFGIFHFSYGSVMEIFGTIAIGLLLGWIYKKSESIIAPILIHFCFNAITIIAVFYLG